MVHPPEICCMDPDKASCGWRLAMESGQKRCAACFEPPPEPLFCFLLLCTATAAVSVGVEASSMGCRMRRRALMNQLLTCSSVRLVWAAICRFSSSVGYGCCRILGLKHGAKRESSFKGVPQGAGRATNAWWRSRASATRPAWAFYSCRRCRGIRRRPRPSSPATLALATASLWDRFRLGFAPFWFLGQAHQTQMKNPSHQILHLRQEYFRFTSFWHCHLKFIVKNVLIFQNHEF